MNGNSEYAQAKAEANISDTQAKRWQRVKSNSTGNTKSCSEYAGAKKRYKISDEQAVHWQQLAAMPRETFEGKLQNPLVKPTTSGLLNGNQSRRVGIHAEAPPVHVEPKF